MPQNTPEICAGTGWVDSGVLRNATRKLFQTARDFAQELDIKLKKSLSGGGSDGNFTAALGIPTLDGLGGVGEGAHAVNESILVDRIADRTALLAMLLSRL